MNLILMNALELFAGVGGITHGLRGYVNPISFCENDKGAAEFLATRGKPVHGDVREFDATEYKGNVDIVTAGWPCTGFSTGGKGSGFDHPASGLWTEVVRVVRECEPRYVFLENSHVLSQTSNLAVVVGDLHALGYDCRWYTCYSNDVNIGAPHQRFRWFCLAFKRDLGVSISKVTVPKFDWSSAPPRTQETENTRENKRLLKLMGNSVVPDQVRHAFEMMLDMIGHQQGLGLVDRRDHRLHLLGDLKAVSPFGDHLDDLGQMPLRALEPVEEIGVGGMTHGNLLQRGNAIQP
jgi:site-specific DNA-cytosine methylase